MARGFARFWTVHSLNPLSVCQQTVRKDDHEFAHSQWIRYPRGHHASDHLDKSNSLSLSLSSLQLTTPLLFFHLFLFRSFESHTIEQDCFQRDSPSWLATKFRAIIYESRFIKTKIEGIRIKSKVSLTEQWTIYEWNKPAWWTARDTELKRIHVLYRLSVPIVHSAEIVDSAPTKRPGKADNPSLTYILFYARLFDPARKEIPTDISWNSLLSPGTNGTL